MDIVGLTDADVELFEHACSTLARHHRIPEHQVAAALRTADGEIFRGLHLGSRRVNVCAEWSALAQAVMANPDAVVTTMVAVFKDSDGRIIVTNPCGVCRELMSRYAPEAEVLVDIRGKVRKVPSQQLLPIPWLLPNEASWAVEEPTANP